MCVLGFVCGWPLIRLEGVFRDFQRGVVAIGHVLRLELLN